MSPVRFALALAAVALAPTAFRAALILDLASEPSALDLRGFVSDAWVALLFLALLVAVGRRLRPVALALLAGWVLLHYGTFEMVDALGALPSALEAGYLGDPTFLRGSVLAPSRPWLLAAVLALSLALGGSGLRGLPLRAAGWSAFAAAPLLGAALLWPPNDSVATWRQIDLVEHNAELLLRRGPAEAPPRFASAAEALLDQVRGLRSDLEGQPRFALPGRARNVLLVVLESVSGAYLESLAGWQGVEPAAPMPALDALARENLAFASFVDHQRKTNRGLYAILCGELPNLLAGLPKMSAYPAEGGRTCLPRILSEAGFTTAYLQAAPLAFMLKDQFMPRAGFEQVDGHKRFPRGYARNVWGVDDRAFFETALERVDELRAGAAPWFLTLLNVGTHHPFVLPDDYRPELEPRAARAMAHLDAAFEPFVAALAKRGVLENTLVLVTSDESLGIEWTRDERLTKTLAQNWGILVVLAPERPRELVTEPYAQMDLALSVLDYLGLAERGDHLFGRSAFRRYEKPRWLFFANTNLQAAGALDPEGRVLVCGGGLRPCRRYRPEGGRPFAPRRVAVPWKEGESSVVREIAQRSLVPRAGDGRRDFALLSDPVFVVDRSESQLIHGGQQVDLRPGEWLEVELEVEARGGIGRGAEVELHHLLKRERPPAPLVERVRLRAGQTYRIRYTYAPDERVPTVQSQSLAQLVGGQSLELYFKKARLVLRRSGRRPEPGLRIEHKEIAPSA